MMVLVLDSPQCFEILMMVKIAIMLMTLNTGISTLSSETTGKRKNWVRIVNSKELPCSE